MTSVMEVITRSPPISLWRTRQGGDGRIALQPRELVYVKKPLQGYSKERNVKETLVKIACCSKLLLPGRTVRERGRRGSITPHRQV